MIWSCKEVPEELVTLISGESRNFLTCFVMLRLSAFLRDDKISCIQFVCKIPLLARALGLKASVLNHSTFEFQDFSERAPGS